MAECPKHRKNVEEKMELHMLTYLEVFTSDVQSIQKESKLVESVNFLRDFMKILKFK